jgi:hypothetical protein
MDVKEVKEVIASRKLVTYDNTDYIVTAYILRLIDRKWQHTLELKDLKANSVRIVLMEKVEVKKC